MGDVIVEIDGTDVTSSGPTVTGSWSRRLNRPSTAQVRIPAQNSIGGAGSILKIQALIGTTYEIVHHGRILLCETEMGEDTGYTTYNSTDPMELWQWRPVRDDDCDFSKPTIARGVRGRRWAGGDREHAPELGGDRGLLGMPIARTLTQLTARGRSSSITGRSRAAAAISRALRWTGP